MPDIIRIIRVLEYIGPRDVLEKHMSQCYVRGQRSDAVGITIREAIIGDFPEIITLDKDNAS